MEDSIFTKIIKGEIPCHKVYEDDIAIAFLDINPLTEGHTLVVPKVQIDHIWDIDDKTYAHLWDVARRVAMRQRKVLQPPRIGTSVEGFAVPHAHIHVMPLYEGFEHTVMKHAARKDDEPDHAALAAMAERLAF